MACGEGSGIGIVVLQVLKQGACRKVTVCEFAVSFVPHHQKCFWACDHVMVVFGAVWGCAVFYRYLSPLFE